MVFSLCGSRRLGLLAVLVVADVLAGRLVGNVALSKLSRKTISSGLCKGCCIFKMQKKKLL
jgi:hypothetical protein